MLEENDFRRFQREGWVTLPEFMADDLDLLVADLYRIFPTPNTYWADPSRFAELQGDQFDSVRTIPTGFQALDRLPFAERFRSIAAQVTGTDNLQLMRGGYQAKFAGAADFDQVLHRDYGNHTLIIPESGTQSDLVGFFAYFTSVSSEDGPTMVVSNSAITGIHPAETHLKGSRWREIYEQEKPVLCKPGTLLVYDYRTFHRGSHLRGTRSHRLTLSFAYGITAPWHGFVSWPNRAEEPVVRDLVASLTPRERELLGFPAPGHRYWTEETIEGLTRRYPGTDASPYLAMLA